MKRHVVVLQFIFGGYKISYLSAAGSVNEMLMQALCKGTLHATQRLRRL